MQNYHRIMLLTYYSTTVYKRTRATFIADDKVVYQRVRRATRFFRQQQSTTWCRLKHFSWRSRWIILCKL